MAKADPKVGSVAPGHLAEHAYEGSSDRFG
jgi:hypothetical protein